MTDTVLLVGGGGREHAIARAIVDDAGSAPALYACADNLNPGIDRLADGYATIDTTDPDEVTTYAAEVGAAVAVVGPEAPLEAGVVDALENDGVYAFGPRAEDARIETDKAFQRSFMAEHGIPGCPDFATFDDPEAACAYVDEYDGDLAVKPTGLTGGKGVRVIGDQVTAEEAKTFIRESEYDSFVLEERLVGEEFTVQALVADGHVRVTPAVQDHKRAYEGDEGPNTGGMGSYSAPRLELPFMREEEYHDAVAIIQATVGALSDYRGILYGQFMLTADGVKVVEYNARFGDPEAMNTLPVMNTPLMDVIEAARDGERLPQLSFTPQATVCKYAVPSGYPESPTAGTKLAIDDDALGDDALFFASVDERDDGIYTTTSRSFAVVGVADSIAAAEREAERALETVGTDGLDVRHDIGTEELIEARIDHMRTLRGEAGEPDVS